ncbi:helix-turn-helix transcriptional regulator [Ruoffia tabacinasalis]|uniref:Helix-turn-helix transcriptional regulator n=1 Tax=Ruoffia tabacinasalis TaxID=87458 RepID=A0A5R9EHD4_9LACT|nr:helix-turn-helix transcriptional regulator [Ruoffia tabacinasalis]
MEVDNAKLDFAVRLAEQRKKAGMTQEELAKKIGKPQSTISRIETGEMNPTIELIIEISIGLDKQLSVEFK